MKISIDTDEKTLVYQDDSGEKTIGLYSKEAFEIISRPWVRVGWSMKYPYTFSWFGRPIIQLPEDMVRIQELIYRLKSDVIMETGIAHGGSLIYYASLCRALQKGRVIGVDIEIRPHNREALETHELFPWITLIEGSSIEKGIFDQVKSLIQQGESVLVLLDSCHTKAHVLKELNMYSDLVTPGSYIIATDGIMKDFRDVPRGEKDWVWDNPAEAAMEFAAGNPAFVIEQPAWTFNESELSENITHWPMAYLKRVQ